MNILDFESFSNSKPRLAKHMKDFLRTKTLFLMGGDAPLRWKCELSNWIGLAFRIPRTMIQEYGDRKDMKRASAYFLIGAGEQSGCVCIGEAENVQGRINQHIADDRWQDWTECVVFVSSNGSLNKAKIKYMESSLYDLALDAGNAS